MKWSMDHVLTNRCGVSEEGKLLKVYCIFNTAVYCHVVLDEGERRKNFILCVFKTD
jgi:hypothetical protein